MIRKRSVAINGHRTSISIEDRFWEMLGVIATNRQVSVAQLVAEIDAARAASDNLSSALRLHILEWALAQGHRRD